MDEVNDPAMTILAEGFFYGGPKSYLLNKIEGTSYLALLLIGQRKNVISTHSKNYINIYLGTNTTYRCYFQLDQNALRASDQQLIILLAKPAPGLYT